MSNHRTAGDFIFEGMKELRQPTEREIGNFNENTENRKHEMYHQGEDEVGELITRLFQYDEEDDNADL